MRVLFLLYSLCVAAIADIPEQGSVLVVIPLYSEAQNKIPTVEAARHLSSVSGNSAKAAHEYELVKCRREKKEKCEIPFSEVGTAFLAGNPRTIWTAAHLFSRAVKGVVRDGPLQFLLLDRKATVIFDSRTDGEGKAQTLAPYDDRELRDSASDFVRIVLPKEMPGVALRFSPEAAKPGDIVKLFTDEGRVTRVAQVSTAAEPGFFFVGYASREGMSGGPVVSPRGQVVGLNLARSAGESSTRVIAAKQLHALEMLKPSSKP